MMKFMCTAIAVGAVGVVSLKSTGLLASDTMQTGYIVSALFGGLVFGVGMAITGTCPGTIFAGAGQGNLDNLIPGFSGFLFGSFVFGILHPFIMSPLMDIFSSGQLTIADILGISPWLMVAVIVIAVVAFFLLSKRFAKAKSDK